LCLRGIGARAKDWLWSKPISDEALKAIERTNELLDEVERLREEWERSREIIESAKQMRIAADGYISTLEKANKALAECVNGALEEMERLQKVNKEIARAAEVMAQVARTLE
jgi:hypothetical protein